MSGWVVLHGRLWYVGGEGGSERKAVSSLLVLSTPRATRFKSPAGQTGGMELAPFPTFFDRPDRAFLLRILLLEIGHDLFGAVDMNYIIGFSGSLVLI